MVAMGERLGRGLLDHPGKRDVGIGRVGHVLGSEDGWPAEFPGSGVLWGNFREAGESGVRNDSILEAGGPLVGDHEWVGV